MISYLWNALEHWVLLLVYISFMTASFHTESQNDWLRSLQGDEGEENGKCLSAASLWVNASSFHLRVPSTVSSLTFTAGLGYGVTLCGVNALNFPCFFVCHHFTTLYATTSVADQIWTCIIHVSVLPSYSWGRNCLLIKSSILDGLLLVFHPIMKIITHEILRCLSYQPVWSCPLGRLEQF